MANFNPINKNLSCLFEEFNQKYPESLIVKCETKENQKWRNATGEAAVKKINIMAKYFPELSLMINSLENYLICEKHYNQIIAKDIFIQNLINTNLVFFSSGEYWQLEKSKESIIEKEYKEIGIQVSLDQDIFLKLSELERQLINFKEQQLEHINLIKNYKQKITELEILNENLFFENTELKEKLNMKLDNQEKRIETIIEIAQKE
jgi:hypothetical protein